MSGGEISTIERACVAWYMLVGKFIVIFYLLFDLLFTEKEEAIVNFLQSKVVFGYL